MLRLISYARPEFINAVPSHGGTSPYHSITYVGFFALIYTYKNRKDNSQSVTL